MIRFPMWRRLLLIILFSLCLTPEASAARQEAPVSPSEIISRLQNLLGELELYKGPTDGQANKALKDAALLYRQGWGLDPLGALDEEFLRHIENSVAMLRLQSRIKGIKEEQIAEARLALSSNPAIRELLRKPPPPRRNVDIPACLRSANVDCLLAGALDSALSEGEDRYREWALHDVIGAEARAGRASNALSVATYIEDPRSLLQAFREIAENLAEAGHLAQAQAVIEIHPDPRGKAEALVFLASAQARRKMDKEAATSLKSAAALLAGIKDPQGRIQILSKMSEIRFRLGDKMAAGQDLQRARLILQELESEARPASRGLIAAALAANADPRGAIGEMQGVSEADLLTPVRMAAVESYAKSGNLGAALIEARAITMPRYRIVALSRLAPMLSKDEAQSALDEALKAAPLIELVYARSYAVSQVAAARLELGDRERALAEALSIEDEQLRAQTLWNIADSNGKQYEKAVAQAEAAGELIPEPFARVYMFAQLAMAAARSGDLNLAKRHFSRAAKAVEKTNTPFLRARSLAALASALATMTR
jgi:hypothetical protein